MKQIDLLNKIAKGEIKEGFRIKGKNGDIYEYKEGKDRFHNVKDHIYVYSLGDFTKLNDEIEIIEEETTQEQNFTGWQIVQNGKVIVSYNAPTLKPVDIADVEKDIKEMLEEKPKKIEKLELFNEENDDEDDNTYIRNSNSDEYLMDNINLMLANKINEIIDYLLEKESDK